MVNYQNGKIYKLWSPSKNIVYIGSTTQPLCKRLVAHLTDYKAQKNNLTSFLILDCEDYKMELLENYPCNNRQQLERKEGEYIRNNECVNKVIAGRTNKEWSIDNADKKKEYMKEHYAVNIDKIKEQQKQYRLDNFDKKKEYNKQFYINNVDKIKERMKQYYLDKKLEQRIYERI